MNSLRISDKPGADTRHMVRSVLAFMADAFEAMPDGNVRFDGSMMGASQILLICADALRESDDAPGEVERQSDGG